MESINDETKKSKLNENYHQILQKQSKLKQILIILLLISFFIQN
jgi:hypothetical protein